MYYGYSCRKRGPKRFHHFSLMLAMVLVAALTLAACTRQNEGFLSSSTADTSSEAPKTQNSASDAENRGSSAISEGSPAITTNTVNQTPVVIVPGILGTELVGVARSDDSSDSTLLWPPIDSASPEWQNAHDAGSLLAAYNTALERLGLLSLDEGSQREEGEAAGNSEISGLQGVSSGRNPAPSLTIEALHVDGGKVPFTGHIGTDDAYRRLYAALAAARGAQNVYFFGYDWRRSNLASAAELAHFIDGILKGRIEAGGESHSGVRHTDADEARVDIVAHSMGGLVVSAFLARPGAAQTVRRVLLVGSPLKGASDAYRIFSGEEHMADSLMAIGTLNLPGDDRAASTSSTFTGPEADSAPGLLSRALEESMDRLMPTYPSVYELMTERDFVRAKSAVEPARQSALLQATAYRNSVTSRLGLIYRNIPVSALIGTGVATHGDSGTSIDGDGLVSVTSAEAGGILKSGAGYLALDHIALVQNPEAIAWIIDHLEAP